MRRADASGSTIAITHHIHVHRSLAVAPCSHPRHASPLAAATLPPRCRVRRTRPRRRAVTSSLMATCWCTMRGKTTRLPRYVVSRHRFMFDLLSQNTGYGADADVHHRPPPLPKVGVIYLERSSARSLPAKAGAEDGGFPLVLTTASSREVFLFSDSEEDRNGWVTALQKVAWKRGMGKSRVASEWVAAGLATVFALRCARRPLASLSLAARQSTRL